MRVSQQHKRNGLVGLVTTTLTSLLLLPLLLLLLLAEAANAAPQQQPGPVANNNSTEGWTLAQYPNPTKPDGARICAPFLNGPTSFLCDPDGVLTPQGGMKVHETLDRINRNDTANCTSAPGGKERIEMGVALVKRLHRSSSDAMQDTAGFGRGLHEQWHLGASDCKLGVVIVVSQLDRSMYISRGKGLSDVLTQARVDEITQHARGYFRAENFSGGVLHVVEEVESDILKGPPISEAGGSGGGDGGHSSFVIIAIMLLVGLGGVIVTALLCANNAITQNEYNEVKKKLERIERERNRLSSLELAGSYDALISCPICLEDFKTGPPLEENDHGTVRRGSDKLGADDKPVTILACGHAYCHACIHDAIRQQTTKRCPICRRDVDEPAAGEESKHQRALGTRDASVAEMRYRLNRLHQQHPNVIRRDMVDRWSSWNFMSGHTAYTADSAFVSAAPSAQTATSSGGGSSFWDGGGGGDFGGGGCSDGGGGGTW